jgi:hypothetical protein
LLDCRVALVIGAQKRDPMTRKLPATAASFGYRTGEPTAKC